MRILKRVPNSLLWLLDYPKSASAKLLRRASQLGINPSRIRFTPSIPKDLHILRLSHVHLYLDTPVYNAHSSAGMSAPNTRIARSQLSAV
jgi:protein O-GlcNAc transferase